MKIAVAGCGRWGSLIAWYLDRTGHRVTLYGRESSPHMKRFLAERRNDLLSLPERITLDTSLSCLCDAEVIVISIASQGLRSFMRELAPLGLHNKIFVLCMKGIEVGSLCRLSEVAQQETTPDNRIAVWLGPGHVQEFYAGIPNCMVIDGNHPEVTKMLVDAFSGELIRFYYGNDLIGNEIGAASKNVIGIAAGILDGLNRSSLKGALMSRSTFEVARLMKAMGANPFSSFGLCHLGDFEATVFSEYSHNRQYGESLVTGCETFGLAEGYYTVAAVKKLAEKYNVDMPICEAVYDVIYNGADVKDSISKLFSRSQKEEFII